MRLQPSRTGFLERSWAQPETPGRDPSRLRRRSAAAEGDRAGTTLEEVYFNTAFEQKIVLKDRQT